MTSRDNKITKSNKVPCDYNIDEDQIEVYIMLQDTENKPSYETLTAITDRIQVINRLTDLNSLHRLIEYSSTETTT